MPIRPENRARYPHNWRAISDRIRFQRAEGRCECRGECGTNHDIKVVGGPIPPRGVDTTDTTPFEWIDDRCAALHSHPHPTTHSKVVLTTAHLDHTPENCEESNLLALCQACHNRLDAQHRAETRAERREPPNA